MVNAQCAAYILANHDSAGITGNYLLVKRGKCQNGKTIDWILSWRANFFPRFDWVARFVSSSRCCQLMRFRKAISHNDSDQRNELAECNRDYHRQWTFGGKNVLRIAKCEAENFFIYWVNVFFSNSAGMSVCWVFFGEPNSSEKVAMPDN